MRETLFSPFFLALAVAAAASVAQAQVDPGEHAINLPLIHARKHSLSFPQNESIIIAPTYMARNIRGAGEREDGVNAAFFICPLSARTCISHTCVMLLMMMLVEDADVSFHQQHMTNDVPDEVGSMYTSEKQKAFLFLTKRVLFP